MGSCFLSLLEKQANLLSAAAEIMAPLGSYKEVGKGLVDSHGDSVVRDATLQWLSAAQVSLREQRSIDRTQLEPAHHLCLYVHVSVKSLVLKEHVSLS